MNILEQIAYSKKEEVALHQAHFSIEQLADAGHYHRVCNSMKQSLLNSQSGIIAEFKRKSPSKGFIHADAKVEEIIPRYVAAGASAISVLTDEPYFGGTGKDLILARSLTQSTPLLRKDFIVDEYQIYEAKALGADVILLIAAILGRQQCKDYAALAHELGMEVLLEIHDEEELSYVHPNADMVGVNNRNLKTFVTDIQTSVRLGSLIPEGSVKVAESGISRPETVRELRAAGFNGFLMGETFMRELSPTDALASFISAL